MTATSSKVRRRGMAAAAALALALVAVTPFQARAAPGPDYLGRWRTQSEGGVVEIYRCGPALCGRIVMSGRLLKDPDARDRKNKSAALRGRRMLGLDLLSGLEPDGAGWKGRLYNPEDGETYSGTMRLTGPGRLKVQGCVLYILCRSQTWTRVG